MSRPRIVRASIIHDVCVLNAQMGSQGLWAMTQTWARPLWRTKELTYLGCTQFNYLVNGSRQRNGP